MRPRGRFFLHVERLRPRALGGMAFCAVVNRGTCTEDVPVAHSRKRNFAEPKRFCFPVKRRQRGALVFWVSSQRGTKEFFVESFAGRPESILSVLHSQKLKYKIHTCSSLHHRFIDTTKIERYFLGRTPPHRSECKKKHLPNEHGALRFLQGTTHHTACNFFLGANKYAPLDREVRVGRIVIACSAPEG